MEFLKDTYEALRDVLQKMKDKLEFGLKVNWDRDEVLAEIERDNEEIRRLKDEIVTNQHASTYFARMQLGRLVEQALADRSDAYVRDIYDSLRMPPSPRARTSSIGDKMIMNAAFLVAREQVRRLRREGARDRQEVRGQALLPLHRPLAAVQLRHDPPAARALSRRVAVLGLLGKILALPYALPKAGIAYCLDRVIEMAENEYYSDEAVKDELLLLQLGLEEGTIDEAEYRRREAPLLVRLREIREHRKQELEELISARRASGETGPVQIDLPEELR